MHIFALFTSFGVACAAAVTATQCNADNCLRAVRASAFPKRPGTADCSRYQTTYSTPVTTITVTGVPPTTQSTTSSTTTTPPPTTPAYASSCQNDARYRSACSCIGQTSTFVVAPTSTVTVTVAAPSACSTFALKASSGAFAGYYLYSNGPNLPLLAGERDKNADGVAHLVLRDQMFYASDSQTSLLYANTAQDGSSIEVGTPGPLGVPLLCSIAPATNAVSCTVNGKPAPFSTTTTFALVFLDYSGASNLVDFVPEAVPLCI